MTQPRCKSNGARGVKSPLGFKIRLVRLLGSVIPSDKRIDAVGAYARAPAAPALEPRHTKKPRGFVSVVRTPLVLYVACGAYVAEVVKAVILRVSVFVVYGVHWPQTSHVKPRQPADPISHPRNANDYAPVGLHGPRHSANHYFSASFNPPCEHPRRRVVAQDFAQLIVCDATVCHSVSMT